MHDTFNPETVRQWLGALHADAPGLTHVCATDDWTGKVFTDLDAATNYAAHLDSQMRQGIYARITTLKTQPPPGHRGGATDTVALPALWADLDLAGPGHEHDPGKHQGRQLPADEPAGRKVIAASGLPEPTIWVHSGGGMYPIWLLDRPHLIDGDLADIKDLAAGWQQVIAHSAAELGWHYGAGVGDLARVLRIPGTINRKSGLTRPCRILSATGARYQLQELQSTLDQIQTKLAAAMAASATKPTWSGSPSSSSSRVDGGISPGDDWSNQTSWAQILEPAGWSLAYERDGVQYWTRAGKRSGVSATVNACGTDRLHVFTTSTAFEADNSYHKFAAWTVLYHGGDFKTAAKALKDQGYGQRSPLSGDPSTYHKSMIDDILGQPSAQATDPPRGQQTTRPAAATVTGEPPPPPGAFGPTEDGLALALVAHHGHELRYCPQRGQWLRWSGHRWLWDVAETHRELIRALARQCPDGPDTDLRKFKARAMSAPGTTGIARLAQSDHRLAVPIDHLDANPADLNTPGGIIDLRTGQIRPPDPAAMHTRSTTTTPDPSADRTTWAGFLVDTFGEDQDLIAYLQRLVGYSAVGMVGSHILPFAHGSGGNGKGVFLEAIAGVLGDYATTTPVGFLMAKPYQQHETEIARLAGARMVICSEVNQDDRFDESRVKQLTGGDSLTARFMRKDHFTFTPTHQLWLMGNHKPAVRTGGRAFWRRLRLIPFTREVPENKIIEDLQGILIRDHGPALLTWIAAGAADYHRAGLREPNTVKTATHAYEHDQDTVARFVEECCRIGGGEHVKTRVSKVREAYEKWCLTEGEVSISAKAFSQTLIKEFSVDRSKGGKGVRCYLGLALIDTGDLPPPGEDLPPWDGDPPGDDQGQHR
jgi:putative DNA primase/helicase